MYFNSRPSARGDAICTHLQQFQKYFNSRPSARGDWGNWVRKIKTIDISIHAPPRGATNTYGAISYYVIFQFTPLREGRRRKFWAAVVSFVFQFTPLREGRPSPAGDERRRIQIAIHAPPRGATIFQFNCCAKRTFQFTPLREGRRYNFANKIWRKYISIHAPPRGATNLLLKYVNCVCISIHAPPRGATPPGMAGNGGNIFQFTPLREGRLQYYQRYLFQKLFQFTPLREGRQAMVVARRCPKNFNSRPSARGDFQLIGMHSGGCDFNSRPSARGDATSSRSWGTGTFQFTPLREGRRIQRVRHQSQADFNSRPSARGDSFSSFARRFKAFQFTPLREGRPSPFCNPGNRELFQFTPLREGRPATVIGGITAQLAFQFTPLREGRPTSTPCRTRRRNFNSRPSARGDRRRRACGWNCEFQFTPLREGRLRRRHPQKRLADFNSRPSARGDGYYECFCPAHKISIHAPPRGATLFSISCGLSGKFQFTPLREGRPRCNRQRRRGAYFNSRPSARGDTFPISLRSLYRISIHAPPRGATQYYQRYLFQKLFQFTPLREGRH